jgi:membrane-bound inhibitor of C-type lysozyme
MKVISFASSEAVAAALLLFVAALPMDGAVAQEPISKVKYACVDSKTIEAAYFADKVDVTLSDGRSMSLPQTMSGSGARYANADESFVFWNKGDTAFITEGTDPNAPPTFADCVEEKG